MRACIILGILSLASLMPLSVDAKPCVFCKEEIKNQTVLQCEHFNVLVDYEPRVKGHLLVIPKRHLAKAHELSKEEWAELSIIIPKAVEVFSKVLHTDQYIIVEKNGPRAFQDIPHVHFHLFPVTSQKWSEIFDIVPRRLSKKEYDEEFALFRSSFSQTSQLNGNK
jgi:histidine triad (HIT) family protein